MPQLNKIKTYILFFDPNELKHKDIGSVQVKEIEDFHNNVKENNYLFYHFENSENGGLKIKKLGSRRNLTFRDFHKKLEKVIQETILNSSSGYNYEISDLDDSQFINLNYFNTEIVENNECLDIWMNAIIISPIALFLTDNIEFARGEFIGANENINPKAFLLEYPTDEIPQIEINNLIIKEQKKLKLFPVFKRYGHLETKPFVTDYGYRIRQIIDNSRANILLESMRK